jgi:hypothetical protein
VDNFETNRRFKTINKSIQSLREPLLMQTEATLMAATIQANQSSKLPLPKKRKAKLIDAVQPINDPYIGMNGKVFKRRG